jgi:hypothetical protein
LSEGANGFHGSTAAKAGPTKVMSRSALGRLCGPMDPEVELSGGANGFQQEAGLTATNSETVTSSKLP